MMHILQGAQNDMRKTSAIRHKHVQIDQDKLDRARSVLGAKTETEAIERALTLVVDEDHLDQPLRQAKGRMRLRKVFR